MNLNSFALHRAIRTLAATVVVPLAGLIPASSAEAGELAEALQPLVDRHVIAGAVLLVANEEKVLDLEAVGVSSTETKAPMQTDALFWIASMTKSMTGTALMMLVDAGKLKLDDPVEMYLPEFKGQLVADGTTEPHPPQHPLTVREVMNHTSGLVVMNDPAFKKAPALKDNIAQFARLPLRREPGTKYEYNNAGIITGARILEVITGMDYVDFMQQRLFTPLEMKETSFWPEPALASRLATSVKLNAEKSALVDVHLEPQMSAAAIVKSSRGAVVPPSMLQNFGGSAFSIYADRSADPAGGIYATASDVGRFCQMLLNGGTWKGVRYLSPEALRTMTSVQSGDVPVNPQEGYGVGWSVKTKDEEGPAVGSFGHRGARKTVMWVDPTNHLVMVLMVQSWELTGDQAKELYQTFFKTAVAHYGHTK